VISSNAHRSLTFFSTRPHWYGLNVGILSSTAYVGRLFHCCVFLSSMLYIEFQVDTSWINLCFFKFSCFCISINLLTAEGKWLRCFTIFLLILTIVLIPCWANRESLIGSCNVCMKHECDCKQLSVTPATIFAPESHSPRKTFLFGSLYSSSALFSSSLIHTPLWWPENGRTVRIALCFSNSFES
jgi:hypothetical protein